MWNMGRIFFSTVFIHLSGQHLWQDLEEEIDDRVDAMAAKMKAEFKAHADDFEWLHKNGYISDWNYDFYQKYGSWVGGKPSFSKSMAYMLLKKKLKQ
jgi:hypothetical protein